MFLLHLNVLVLENRVFCPAILINTVFGNISTLFYVHFTCSLRLIAVQYSMHPCITFSFPIPAGKDPLVVCNLRFHIGKREKLSKKSLLAALGADSDCEIPPEINPSVSFCLNSLKSCYSCAAVTFLPSPCKHPPPCHAAT